ncbi:MAG TPA: dTDP-4-dehydrorhamnose reductase [Candidatus Acidoferrum sp.]|nr:dTDP-4-dehydrorhamnose reductase [Candidatus Acidoferrum sp.]
MKLLVTGGSGLLGGSIVRQAISCDHEVCATFHTHHPSQPGFVNINLTEPDSVKELIRKEKPEVIIHSAALTDVDFCERDPEAALQINGFATANLSRICKQTRRFLIYVSTDYVFDGSIGNYDESAIANPINAYGASKLIGEEQVASHCDDFCIVRTSVVYGWGREYRPNFATRLYESLKLGQKTAVVADQYASPTLNTQLARMLLEVAEHRLNGTLHLTGDQRVGRYEFAVQLAEKFNFDARLIEAIQASSSQWIARRPRDSSLNVSKARNELRNKPVNLAKALDEFASSNPLPNA